MKRYWVLNFVFAAIFIASTAMQTSTTPPGVPADTTKLRVEMTDKGQLRLQVHGENNTGKKLRLAIVKKESSSLSYASESVIYNEFIKADNVNFERMLNLSQLENGTYEIEVTGGKQRFVRSITLQTTAEAVQKPREIVF